MCIDHERFCNSLKIMTYEVWKFSGLPVSMHPDWLVCLHMNAGGPASNPGGGWNFVTVLDFQFITVSYTYAVHLQNDGAACSALPFLLYLLI